MILKNSYGSLDRIRSRGYVSYSSLSALRDNKPPLTGDEEFLRFGVELHSRFLEGKVIQKLTPEEEEIMRKMLLSLSKHTLVRTLMQGSEVEQEINQTMLGIKFIGYIDILKPKILADLKSTSLTTKQAFIDSMDFLQPVIYRKATGIKDFYYIGISKKAPHEVFTFNANDYPNRLKESEKQLTQLIRYVKENL